MTRVLVADDSETVLLMMTRRLEMEGYDVITADNGSQVVEIVSDATPDEAPQVILLDVMMPSLSGVEALQQIRADGCRIPVLMVSAHLDITESHKMREIGAEACISKPIDWHELIALIQKLASTPAAG